MAAGGCSAGSRTRRRSAMSRVAPHDVSFSLRRALWGEPSTHPRFPNSIAYACIAAPVRSLGAYALSAVMLSFKTGPSPRQLLVLLACSIAVRGLFILEPPGSDQGLFLSEAGRILQGARLYDGLWEHKPPGIIALYVIARVFAHDYVSIHLLNWLVGLLSATLLVALALRYGASRTAAMFSGVAYLAFFAGPLFGGFWAIAQAETFLDPLLGAALLLLAPGSPATMKRRAFAAGLLIGSAIATIKYSAAPWCLLAILLAGRSSAPTRLRLTNVAIFLAGCLLPGLCLVAYFAATGRAQAWFDATLLFNAEHQHVGAASFWADPLQRLFPAAWQLLVLYGFAVVAIASRVRTLAARGRENVASRAIDLGVLLWVLALAQVFIQRKFWAYHYHVTLFPLCLLAGFGFARSRDFFAGRTTQRRALLACTALGLIASIGYGQRFASYLAHHRIIDRFSGSVAADQFYLSYAWGDNEYNYQVDRMVAQQVTQSTQPTDPILVWAFEPVIYDLSARPAASRFLYDYPITQPFSSLHEKYVGQLLDDLEARPPVLLITRTGDRDNLEPDDSLTQLQQIPPLAAYLVAHYTRAWVLGDFVCFRRTH
jgi:hypothetical protein